MGTAERPASSSAAVVKTSPVVLFATATATTLGVDLETAGFTVARADSGAEAVAKTRKLLPDAILISPDLSDLDGAEVCERVRTELPSLTVPMIIVATDPPAAAKRIAALRAGAWDYLRYPEDLEELLLKLRSFVFSATRVRSDGPTDPMTGLQGRPLLARRARELGALLARKHGALACVVFALEVGDNDVQGKRWAASTARMLKNVERISDVLGALGPTEFAMLAPATDHAGAVQLARRIAAALRIEVGGAAPQLRVGYDAVANLRYSPIDPAKLVSNASEALRSGVPEPGFPWMRRFGRGREGNRTTQNWRTGS